MKTTWHWVIAVGTGALGFAAANAANPPAVAPSAAPKPAITTKTPSATSSPALQNNHPNASASAGDALDRDDRRFLQIVAAAEQTDVALAQLAADRTEDPRIRRFAEQLGRDHTALDLEAAALARARNIPVENDLVGDRTYRTLAHRKAAQFDGKFLDTIVERRQRDIARYEEEIRIANDPDVQSFAKSHLATLRQQLATAQSLE